MENVNTSISTENGDSKQNDYLINVSFNGIQISLERLEVVRVEDRDVLIRLSGSIKDFGQQIESFSVGFGSGNLEKLSLIKENNPEYSSFSEEFRIRTLPNAKMIPLLGKVSLGKGSYCLRITEIDLSRSFASHELGLVNEFGEIKSCSEQSIKALSSLSESIRKMGSGELFNAYHRRGFLDLDQMEILKLSLFDLISTPEAACPGEVNSEINLVLSEIKKHHLSPFKGPHKRPYFSPEILSEVDLSKRPKIVILASEFEYITTRTTCSMNLYSLAKRLSSRNEVSVVLVCDLKDRYSLQQAIDYYANLFSRDLLNVSLIPQDKDFELCGSEDPTTNSYLVYSYLKSNVFNKAIIEGSAGLGYFSLLAKSQGVDFQNQKIELFLEDSRYWDSLSSNYDDPLLDSLAARYMEKESIKLAPKLVTYRRKIFDLARFDPFVFTRPDLYDISLAPSHNLDSKLILKPTEEVKENLLLITDAPLEFIHTIKDEFADFELLLAPQIEDGVEKEISRIDKIISLILESNAISLLDREHQYFDYLVAFCSKNGYRYQTFALVNGRFKIENHQTQEVTSSDLKDELSNYSRCEKKSASLSMDRNKTLPLVSVCMLGLKKSDDLEISLRSVIASTYSNIEVIVILDESFDADQGDILKGISSCSMTVVRQQLTNTAYARNVALGHSKGKYVLFVDQGNVIFPKTIETLLNVAERNEIHFLSAAFEYPRAKDIKKKLIKVFIGPDKASGIFSNVFGETLSLLRRVSLLKLGGFDGSKRANLEAWELFARAALNNYPCSTCPVPLGAYSDRSIKFGHESDSNGFGNVSQVISPYEISNERRLKWSFSGLKKAFQILSSTCRGRYKVDAIKAKESFLHAEKVLLSLSGQQLEEDLITSDYVTKIPTPEGLIIETNQLDPQVILPLFELNSSGPISLHVSLISKQEEVAKVYYMTRDRKYYCEEQQFSVEVRSGRNEIYVSIPKAEDLHLPLRFDPGVGAGQYLIERLEINSAIEGESDL